MIKLIHSITLPIELTNRNGGRGFSWHGSAREKKRLMRILHAVGKPLWAPLNQPVEVEITRILGIGQRLWDYDSILRGNSKELLDAMVTLGWFRDDRPQWITRCDGRQCSSLKDRGPAVRVDIYGEINA